MNFKIRINKNMNKIINFNKKIKKYLKKQNPKIIS